MLKYTVLFFGATAALAGRRRMEFSFDEEIRAGDVYEKVLAEHPSLKSHSLHLSVNQQFANGDEMLKDGDELAIFTAVSGG